MKSQQAIRSTATLFGGDWSLDFANSWSDWEGGYLQLLAWSRQVGFISEQQAQAMERKAESSPEEARATFERALIIQRVIHNIFWTIAHGQPVESSDLLSLNRHISLVMGKLRLRQEGDAFQWGWEMQNNE